MTESHAVRRHGTRKEACIPWQRSTECIEYIHAELGKFLKLDVSFIRVESSSTYSTSLTATLRGPVVYVSRGLLLTVYSIKGSGDFTVFLYIDNLTSCWFHCGSSFACYMQHGSNTLILFLSLLFQILMSANWSPMATVNICVRIP